MNNAQNPPGVNRKHSLTLTILTVVMMSLIISPLGWIHWAASEHLALEPHGLQQQNQQRTELETLTTAML